MKRIQRTLAVAIIGMAMLGFGLITAVEALKPPPPLGEYPDAVRIVLWSDENVIDKSDASYIRHGWVYRVDETVDETELFPQPIRVQAWIRPAGSGDDAWCEIKLSRYAIGHGKLTDVLRPDLWDIVVGPLFRWYAYFEPYTFDVGEYETRILYTSKDPDSPSDRLVVFDGSGLLTVLEGGISQ